MTIAVANSSVIILYARIGRLDILQQAFSEIFIPPAVLREVTVDETQHPGAAAILNAQWIRMRPLALDVSPASIEGLDRGETEAIQLARQLGGDLRLLLDDQRVSHS
jgi:uncharacterized protein